MSRNYASTVICRRLLPAVVIVMFAVAACTPWYKDYNLETKNDLTQLSAVPELTRALQEGEQKVRIKAAAALQDIGPPARDAIPYLKEALIDESDSVRQAAADALKAIVLTIMIDGEKTIRDESLMDDEETAIAVIVLEARLKSGSWMKRRDAARQLGEMGEVAAPAVPSLIMVLTDDSIWHDCYYEVRRAAAVALGNIGLGATDANPALIEALSNRNYDVRLEAVKALGKIGPVTAVGVVEALAGVVDDPDLDVRRESAVSLGNFENYAVFALPVLIEAGLTDMEVAVRQEAIRAIGRIGPTTDDAVNALSVALLDRDPVVRKHAVVALRNTDTSLIREIVPDIVFRLNDTDEKVRLNAVKTLVEHEIDDDQVLDALRRLAFEDKSRTVRQEADDGLIRLKN